MHHSGLALIGKSEMALMGKVQVRFARVPNELRRDVLSSLSLASDFRPRMRSDSDSANADRLADTVLALALGRPGGEAQSLASSRRTAAGFACPARAGGVASAGRGGHGERPRTGTGRVAAPSLSSRFAGAVERLGPAVSALVSSAERGTGRTNQPRDAATGSREERGLPGSWLASVPRHVTR